MSTPENLLRQLPAIDALLDDPSIRDQIPLLGRGRVVDACREAVSAEKRRVLDGEGAPDAERIRGAALQVCRRARADVLGRVINGTGVLLHTNLGRAPLGAELLRELSALVGGYCNLEIDVLDRHRSRRGPHVSRLLAELCGSEDALVVNNNAAALFLALRELAAGREVVVSRGELVQIGGGFRIPDILRSSGATLREVGTTNVTALADYEGAVGDQTAAILKVHHSNFRMRGFVETPSLRELAGLRRDGRWLIMDLGSGNPVRNPPGSGSGEPTPREMLAGGADLVCFSCDKLLGGVQGGAIAGRAQLVERIARNPVMRTVRVDKLTYAALQVVLSHHLAGEHENVALWSLAEPDRGSVAERARAIVGRADLAPELARVVDSEATFGGGSAPGEKIPSASISLESAEPADEVARWFQRREPPVLGTVRDGTFRIDPRTVLPEDEQPLVEALREWSQRS